MTTAKPILRSNRNSSHGRIALGVAIAMALGLPAISGHGADPVRPSAAASPAQPATRAVTNCDNDGPGSLRSEVAAAASGDTIDLSSLKCSTITLTSGAIDVPVDDLAIAGPGADVLAVDGNEAGRVVTHTGTGTLGLSGVTIRNGKVQTSVPYDLARGGCLLSAGTVALDDAAVESCTAAGYDQAQGGCIDAGALSLVDSRLDGCTARIPETSDLYANGGAVAVFGYGNVDITRSLVTNNTASAPSGGAHGGALLAEGGSLTVIDSTLSNNTAIGRPYAAGPGYFTQRQAMGGAIFNGGPLTIEGSTLSGNSATTGGAIAALTVQFADDTVRIENSTISGNTASSKGGGIWMIFDGISILNSTITANHAEYGAGGLLPRHNLFQGYYDFPPNVQSSIIAGNTSYYGSADVDTDLTQFAIVGSNNIIGDSAVPIPPDTISGDPLLMPLADNGGTTWTHALQATSPALDAGTNPSALAFDQRGDGFPREFGPAVDIGAFEYQGPSGIPDTERAFLQEIYDNMHPELWVNSAGWNGPPGTECTWFGITCDGNQEHVIAVEMVQNNMFGPLPASLSGQTQLRVFNLRANKGFTGTIPSLSALTSLEVFEASQLEGGGDGSGLTGELPSLTGLSQLWRFNVQHNSLSGELPRFAPADGLTSLREFVATLNWFTGTLPSFDGVPNLAKFYVNANDLTGEIPELAGLANLEVFVASENGLTGKIPEIAGLSNLRAFYVNINNLDRINESFQGLPALEEYVAAYNEMEGEVDSLDGAPNLVQFNVYDNRLTGELPSLSALGQLEYFWAHSNEFTGELPELQGLQQLKYFHVSDNNLTGTIPPISGMQDLAGFGVSNNQLSGSIPLLEDLPVLFDFDVSNNQLTGNIPPLVGAPNLWEFLANDNLLTGTIPRIGSMQMLVTFNVANNLLEGPPPPVVPSSLRPINSVNGDRTALCPNNLDRMESPAWDAATGVTPWYRDCTGSADIIYSDGFDGTP